MENVGIAAVINEMLLHSFNGKIRLFPALGDDQSARIANMRAVGAFLVASEIDKGQVKYVRIKSLKGRRCTIYNPYKTTEIRLTDLTIAKETEFSVQKELSFDTEAGHEYLIEKKQSD